MVFYAGFYEKRFSKFIMKACGIKENQHTGIGVLIIIFQH